MTYRKFISPYIGVADKNLFLNNGDHAVVMQILNPVLQYSADEAAYQRFHQVFQNVLNVLGPGHTLQKLDLFIKETVESDKHQDFLQEQYQDHFRGRDCTRLVSYLVVIKNAPANRFFQYGNKTYDHFRTRINRVTGILRSAHMLHHILEEQEIQLLIRRFLTCHFKPTPVSYHNLHCAHDRLEAGAHHIKSTTLIDIETLQLPASLSPYTHHRKTGMPFPVDLMQFLQELRGYEHMIYHQVIRIPDQSALLQKLNMKRKRHASMPDPANKVSVRDIDALLEEMAGDQKFLVQAHYNLVLHASKHAHEHLQAALESRLFQLGIIPSHNDFNQLELFQSILPGNTAKLKPYNQWLSTADAALCLLCKERYPTDEPSDFRIQFTDRKGVPIRIDTNELPVRTGRINNRNKFVLGPSGSGKSFFMNHLLRQYFHYDMDIVLVDTGHSYEGLCHYYGGKYITYSEDQPITMNPFRICRKEFNEEKREFLKSLIGLLWKGVDGRLSQIEDTMISKVIHQYFDSYWKENGAVAALDFDSFYHFSISAIEKTCKREQITFDLETYRFVLRKFCREGHYGHILNEDMDSSLFDAPWIVFEIDAIKEHKILFPITTLIIMDVFLQKMRLKSRRKCLVIEEAWKAIASPLMAGYILYLYKTIRKFHGEAIVVTQELDDIIGNAIVKDSIISNSDTLCLLDQSRFRDNFDEIARLLSLNEVEQRKIFTLNQLDNRQGRGKFKEVYIRRGATGEVYGVEVSLAEYLTYTTERREKEAVRAFVKDQTDYREAISAFISAYGESGLDFNAFIDKIHSSNLSDHEN